MIILNRSNRLRADEVVKKQIDEAENIDLLLECRITKINSKEDFIYEIETNKGNFSIDALFSYIGYEPSVSFLDSISMDNNYIVVDERMKTNRDSIYACGDIIKKDIINENKINA